MLREFVKFLKEFNVASLAVGFVMGTASSALVKSLVADIIMPIIAPLMSPGGWRESTFSMGPIVIAYGSFLAELINFIILALIIFFVAKKILKMELGDKK